MTDAMDQARAQAAAMCAEFTPDERMQIRVHLGLLPEPTRFVTATDNGIEPL